MYVQGAHVFVCMYVCARICVCAEHARVCLCVCARARVCVCVWGGGMSHHVTHAAQYILGITWVYYGPRFYV